MGQGAPAAGRDEARAALVHRYDAARSAHDAEGMAEAALGLAAMQAWGTVPGRLPAFLHDAYVVAEGSLRAQLAVAIARVWAYSGDLGRAATFAAEAVADAEQRHDPVALAAALDASLLVRWGPDDMAERLRITARLEDAVAHLSDVEARLSAHLWRLTTALEALDLPAALRQLRALSLLAEESRLPRVVFFSSSRHAMHGLLIDDIPAARAAAKEAITAGWEAGEADAYAIERALTAAIARQVGDVETCAAEAALFETAGLREGMTAVAAEASLLWHAAGEPGRAASLLHRLASAPAGGTPFSSIKRDAEWLLTIASLTEVAAALGIAPLCQAAIELLEPCAGRGVVNAGAVGFVGVVDDYLARACAALGRDAEARDWDARAAAAYAGVGAVWWARRTGAHAVSRAAVETPRRVLHLRPSRDGIWWVGREGALVAIRDTRGLHHLRVLLGRPGADVAAVELTDAAAGRAAPALAPQDGLEVLDRAALVAYRRRLADIDGELDDASRRSDPSPVDALSDEREALLAQLRAATGRHGRARRTGGTDERARIAVRKAVAAAIARIGDADADAGRMLADTVRTGVRCRYDPDPHRPVTWVLGDPGA